MYGVRQKSRPPQPLLDLAGCCTRAGRVLVEEADELGAGVRPVGVGVGAVRDTAGPGMAALVDGPVLGQGRARGVLVAGAGVGMPAGYLPRGHRGRRGARAAV